MNALTIAGRLLSNPDLRDQYFDGMAKWGFDVACTTYLARSEDAIKQDYIAFAEDAHRRGYPACVKIETATFALEAVEQSEAQLDENNTPIKRTDSFLASAASEKWLEYLKRSAEIFVQDYGYDWIVFDEPQRTAGIPGPDDRLRALFQKRYPDVEYPTSPSESASYLRLQRLKADVVVEFCTNLIAHTKESGAKKVGLAPRPFIPGQETSGEAMDTSSDIGRLAGVDQLDFLVVEPRTAENTDRAAFINYAEVMAHACGKPVMAAVMVTDDVSDASSLPWRDRNSLLGVIAAGPTGTLAPWTSKPTQHLSELAQANNYANRLGDPVSPVAFMFGYRGSRHIEPYDYENVWPFYWDLAKRMLFEAKLPMRVIYADALAKSLEGNPGLQVVVLEEHFPLSISQARVLRQWWTASPGRAVVVFGSGVGYSAEEDRPGEQPMSGAFHEILQAIGIRQEAEPQVSVKAQKTRLKHVSRVLRTAFLGDSVEVSTDKIANFERIFGSRSATLYEEENGKPVIVQHSVGDSHGYFCGVGLSEATAPLAVEVIKYALDRLRIPPPIVTSESPGLLWNQTGTGYTIISNVSDSPAEFRLSQDTSLVWDVVNRTMLQEESLSSLQVEPNSFRLLRRVGKRSKLYDIAGAVFITSITDGAGRADIEAFTGPRLSFLLRTDPKEIRVDGRRFPFETTRLRDAVEVVLDDLTTEEHLFTIRW